MKPKPIAPKPQPNDKCRCGHPYAEHLQVGETNGCRHGADPPYNKLCACKSFKYAAR